MVSRLLEQYRQAQKLLVMHAYNVQMDFMQLYMA